jgi:hypothetical protein
MGGVIEAAPCTPLTLRCHRCSHAVGVAPDRMRLVGIFKPSLMGRVGRGHTDEHRKRCPSCGWVNVFHPLGNGGEVIEVK